MRLFPSLPLFLLSLTLCVAGENALAQTAPDISIPPAANSAPVKVPVETVPVIISPKPLSSVSMPTPSVAGKTVWLEDMTWQEVRDALKAGKTTVIIPTGGTEQNGPAVVLGKHNFILRYTAMAIAQRLGNALVAPVLPYVPEGSINPPEGHMRFPGTMSLRPETFAAVLEDIAHSLKQHGFKTICFVGEHGASQEAQKAVAQTLSAEWAAQGVKVLQVGDYYDDNNGQVAWMAKAYPQEQDIEAHGGFADVSEMLATHPQGIRNNLRGAYSESDFAALGVGGSSVDASRMVGAKLVDMKVAAAVKQIQQATHP
jgi:creatinine amidohydrolase/Fe(II)-dependent formamide hydrolase-like protein